MRRLCHDIGRQLSEYKSVVKNPTDNSCDPCRGDEKRSGSARSPAAWK